MSAPSCHPPRNDAKNLEAGGWNPAFREEDGGWTFLGKTNPDIAIRFDDRVCLKWSFHLITADTFVHSVYAHTLVDLEAVLGFFASLRAK